MNSSRRFVWSSTAPPGRGRERGETVIFYKWDPNRSILSIKLCAVFQIQSSGRIQQIICNWQPPNSAQQWPVCQDVIWGFHLHHNIRQSNNWWLGQLAISMNYLHWIARFRYILPLYVSCIISQNILVTEQGVRQCCYKPSVFWSSELQQRPTAAIFQGSLHPRQNSHPSAPPPHFTGPGHRNRALQLWLRCKVTENLSLITS